MLDRRHAVVLWRYSEIYHIFQSQHNLHSQSDAQATCFG